MCKKTISIVQAVRMSELGEDEVIITPVIVGRKRVSALVEFRAAPGLATLVDYRDVYHGTRGILLVAGRAFYNVCGCCPARRPDGLPREYKVYEVFLTGRREREDIPHLVKHYNDAYAEGLRKAIARSGVKTVAVREAGEFQSKFRDLGAEIVEHNKFRKHLKWDLPAREVESILDRLKYIKED